MKATDLELTGVTLRFGGHLVLDDIDLLVEAGSIHAVIGPNGAGKSTLFGVIAGEHSPQRGTVRMGERDLNRAAGYRRVGMGVARAFQVAHVFPDFTVRENVAAAIVAARRGGLNFFSGAPMRRARDAAERALEDLGMRSLAGRKARELSQGDRKRLEIAMSLELEPTVLLLDEPTAGMSPEETAGTVTLIQELWQRTGLTVLLTEHDMTVVFGLAQQLTVLNAGRILATGDPADVRLREDVREVYLGRGHGTS